jgi:hypothetical protein
VDALHPHENASATETVMKRPAWLRKGLWLFPLLLLVILLAGAVAVRLYLSQARAAHLVGERLQSMLGGRVEVQSADVGLIGDSTVQGIRAFADGEDDKPWLQIDDVKADVSALSALRGKSPDAIQLRGAKIALRFSTSGHMLTQMPARKKAAPTEVPHLQIEGAELTLDQEGQPPMVIRGIDAEIAPGTGGLTLTGTIHDPFWGDWKARGSVDTAAGKSSITLDTDGVDVTMEKLRSIAFVPPKVWREVHVEGHTPAQVQLDVRTGEDKPKFHYRVEVAPRDAHVQVPSIDLDATQARGNATVEDELVTLRQVHGKIAGGEITLSSGDLNFREEPTRLAFKVGVREVLLHDLPRSWKVPRNIDGHLTGSADLVVTIEQGKAKTAGSGSGEITQASWGGFHINKPIRLALHSDGRRFHFRQPKPVTITQQDSPEARARADELTAAVIYEIAAEASDREGPEGGGLLDDAPSRLVALLGRGVRWGTDQLSRGLDATTRGLGKLKPPPQPGEEPTYLDVDLSLQNVDVSQLIQKLKLKVPVTVAGRLTVQVHASIPVNTPGDTKAYRLRGDAKMPRLNIAGLEMTDVEAKARYADGVLDLEQLRGRMPPPKDSKAAGTFEGDAHVQVVPQGELHVKLKVEQIPLGVVLNLLPATKDLATGVLSGDLDARASMATLAEPSTWRGSAHLSSPAFEVYGLTVRDASATVEAAGGKATLKDFKADVAGTPLTGDGHLDLKGAYMFEAGIHLDRIDLAELNRLAPSFRPPVEIKGSARLNAGVSGMLKPLTIDTGGVVRATELVAEGVKVDDLSFHWSRADGGLKLASIRARLYDGQVTGSALIPLSDDAPGDADLHLRDLNVTALVKSLPSFPVRLEGKVSGEVTGKLAAATPDRPRAWTTDVTLTAAKMRVQGIPTEKLKGTIDSRGGKTSYDLEGESLGGTFSIKGSLPPMGKPKKEKPAETDGPGLLQARFQQPEEPAGQGRLTVNNARLSRLWDAYNITGGLAHLRGRFSINLPYRHSGPTFFPVGNGTFRIVNVRWDDELLGDTLQGDVRLSADELQVFNVTGDAAGGLFLGRFVFGLKPNSNSWFDIELQQAEASRVLVPLPAVAAHVSGPVDLNFRGRIGPEWDGGGGATLVRGRVFGLDVTEWRIPMQFRFVPTQGAGELTVRDSHARIAQGRARFESTLNWGNGLRLRGTLLFFQVDLRTLLRHHPELSSYASGRVSGRIDLSGDEMRSVNDLRAVVNARLEQGQALQLPVLRQITPYLRPGVSSATFQSGDLKGRLAGGVFNIERLTLVGDLLQLFIQGTVTLAGNLNLEVTAQTGLYCLNPTRYNNGLGPRIPLVGAIPRLVLYEASSLLANRVVHLRVTGTLHSPIVRLEPIILLTEEAVRFFLGRLIAPAIPALP